MIGAAITVDLVWKRPLPRIHAMQGEKNIRCVACELLRTGVPWEIPDGAAVVVHYRRGDGTGGSYATMEDGTSAVALILGNTIQIRLCAAVCAVAGPVTLTVELSKDGAVIVTWPILLQVTANPGCQALEDYVEAMRWPPNRYLGTDEAGNVVTKDAPTGDGTGQELFVKMDLSGYSEGLIKRIYADGGESNLDVTFDANGNPIKFSNGVEEFEVVWPAEEATGE